MANTTNSYYSLVLEVRRLLRLNNFNASLFKNYLMLDNKPFQLPIVAWKINPADTDNRIAVKLCIDIIDSNYQTRLITDEIVSFSGKASVIQNTKSISATKLLSNFANRANREPLPKLFDMPERKGFQLLVSDKENTETAYNSNNIIVCAEKECDTHDLQSITIKCIVAANLHESHFDDDFNNHTNKLNNGILISPSAISRASQNIIHVISKEGLPDFINDVNYFIDEIM